MERRAVALDSNQNADTNKRNWDIKNQAGGATYLCRFDDLSKIFQYGLDIIFQSLVIVLQKSLFTLREDSLCSHRARDRDRPDKNQPGKSLPSGGFNSLYSFEKVRKNILYGF